MRHTSNCRSHRFLPIILCDLLGTGGAEPVPLIQHFSLISQPFILSLGTNCLLGCKVSLLGWGNHCPHKHYLIKCIVNYDEDTSLDNNDASWSHVDVWSFFHCAWDNLLSGDFSTFKSLLCKILNSRNLVVFLFPYSTIAAHSCVWYSIENIWR